MLYILYIYIYIYTYAQYIHSLFFFIYANVAYCASSLVIHS